MSTLRNRYGGTNSWRQLPEKRMQEAELEQRSFTIASHSRPTVAGNWVMLKHKDQKDALDEPKESGKYAD